MTIARYAVTTVLGLLACAGLSACGPQPMDKTGPSFAIDTTVELSPAAAAALKAADEHIVVTAHYYGYPAKDVGGKVNVIGQVELGVDRGTATLEAPRAHISGAGVDRTRLGGVANGIVYVWLSTRNATKAGWRGDRLECNDFRGTMAKAQAATISTTCDLAKTSD